MRRVNPADIPDILEVARQHSTRIAAEHFDLAPSTIVRLRKTHDHYTRGRGHPTSAELAREPARDDCPCARCRTARGVTIPRLTPEQQRLVEDNVRLVGFFIGKWKIPAHEAEDAHQDGLLGLMRAAQLFDPTRGFRFSTFAQHQIRAAVQRGRARFEGISFRQEHRNSAPPLHAPWNGRPASLDAPVADTEHLTLGDTIPGGDDTEADALRHQHLEAIRAAVADACRDDIDRSAAICLAGLDTYVAAGQRHGISHQAVRMRAERLKTRLRHPSIARYLDPGTAA